MQTKKSSNTEKFNAFIVSQRIISFAKESLV